MSSRGRASADEHVRASLSRTALPGVPLRVLGFGRTPSKTVVMVTHDPHAASFTRRQLHLEKGLMVENALERTEAQ